MFCFSYGVLFDIYDTLLKQIPSKTLEEELRKLHSMVSNLENDMDNFVPSKQMKTSLPANQMNDDMKSLQTMIDEFEEKANAFENRKKIYTN